ncbi:MAG: hypothetical protein J0L82_19670 [Deltaproteobacteria bacterium]|nr:hypothetical protein [Deltaproteobacteria bacterium]
MKAFFCIALATLTACGDRSSSVEFVGNDESTSLTQPPWPLMTSRPATQEQCAYGGVVYTVIVDSDRNGRHDEGEVIASEQVVCHGRNGEDGTDGANGYDTFFSMQRIATAPEACEARFGVQLNSGLDTNRNRILEASEIDQTQIICDGVRGLNGDVGPTGPAGSNGHSMVFKTLEASVEQCGSQGGTIILMALDVDDEGIYLPHLPQTTSATLCNGSTPSVTNYTPVEAIQPCGAGPGFREVLLRLSNGQVLASLSNNAQGDMTRLAFLPDGTYMTTDSMSCRFSLSSAGQVRSVAWSNQVQMQWPISY